MSITPINRYTEQVIEDDGTRAYKVYNKASPHYYMDKTGSFHSIDVTDIQTITKASVGVIKLREKNVASIGLRTDGNKTKYLGIRPDNTQEDGSQQLEWTIEEAIINNTTQSITLNQTSSIDGVTTNLGGQVVQSTRHYTRQMVPVTGSISNFQVKYKLHLTGLQISNSKDTGTDYYTSDNGYFKIADTDNNVKFLVPLPVLLDSNFEQVTNDTRHTLKDNGDNTYEYIKYPSDNLLSSGISGSVRYIDATSIYGDADLDGFAGVANILLWNAAHDHATGTTSNAGQSEFLTAVQVKEFSFVNNAYTIYRAFFGFDTSAISSTPTSGQFRVASNQDAGALTADLIVIEATHTEIVNGTFNDFTGFGAGWDEDDVTAYTDEWTSITDDEEYNNIPLISAALSAISSNDTTKLCLMEHDHDYKDDTIADSNTSRFGLFFTENSDTSLDPYLYLVVPIIPTATKRFNILSGRTLSKGGRIIIK